MQNGLQRARPRVDTPAVMIDDPDAKNGIFVTELVYVRPGREPEFLEFETQVLPLLSKHGGELLLRLRPPANAMMGGSYETPFEVHLVRFASEAHMAHYVDDPQRRRALHLKDDAVRASIVVQGSRVR